MAKICPDPDCDLPAGHDGWHDDPSPTIPDDDLGIVQDDDDDGGSNFVNVALSDEATLAVISALPVLGVGSAEEQAEKQAEFDAIYPVHKRVRQINTGFDQNEAPTTVPRLVANRPNLRKGENFASFVLAPQQGDD